MGLFLRGRNARGVDFCFRQNGHVLEASFEVLAQIPFTSGRKRMTTVLREIGTAPGADAE